MQKVNRRTFLKTGVTITLGTSVSSPVFLGLTSSIAADNQSLPSNNASVKQIAARVQVLMGQMRAGLDYYGHPRNYVPTLSVSAYEVSNQELVDNGRTLEGALLQYTDAKADQAKQLYAFDISIAQAKDQQDKNNDERNTIVQTSAPNLSILIGQLLDQEVAALATVNQTSEDLKRALEEAGPGCSFSEILAVASLIITMCTGVPPVLDLIASSASDAFAGFEGVSTVAGAVSSISTAIKDFKKIQGGINELTNDYNSLKAQLGGKTPSPGFDGTKFLISDSDFSTIKQKFESQINSLPDSPEKSAYESAVNNYLGIVQQRNQQLLAYDGLVFRLAAIDKNNQDLAGSLRDLADKETAIKNSQIISIVDEVNSIRETLLKAAYFGLVQHSRALDYWTLDPKNPPSIMPDFGTLAGSLAELKNRKTLALDDLANPPQEILVKNIEVTLNQAARESFAKTGLLRFLIDNTNSSFKSVHLNSILVNTVEVTFFAGQTQQTIGSYKLEHSGYHAFYNNSGSKLEFVSKPRRVYFQNNANGDTSGIFSYTDEKFDANNSTYVGVSPFTSWSVILEDSTKINNLKPIDRLVIQMHCTGRA